MPSSLTNGNPVKSLMTDPAWRALRRMAAGGLVGGVIGYAGAASGALGWLKDMPAADRAAIYLAIILGLAGIGIAIVSTRSSWFARAVEDREPGDTEPVDPGAIRSARVQALVSILAAAVLATPPVAVLTGINGAGRDMIAGALIATIVVQTWFNWRLWRTSDELTRALIVRTGALCFWGLQLALFTWAALARIGVLPDFGSWIAAIVTMAVYLVASMGVAIRLGLGGKMIA